MRKFLNWRNKRFASILLILLSPFILDRIFPLPAEKPWSRVVLANDGSLLASYLSSDDKWRMRTSISEVPPELVTAILEKEDKWFFSHSGVNPVAVLRALWSNITSGKRVSGASTISMQVARLMQPRERTMGSKIVEMFRALQLEWHYSKKEIFEMYLSYLPYGGNVEGVKAAAYIYFGKPPSQLSLSQCVMLTIIPNRPNSLRLDRNFTETVESRDKWLKKFRQDKVFDDALIEAALVEPVENARYEIAPRAPHFSRFVSARYHTDEVRTTLNPAVQQTAENLLAGYVKRTRAKGITNGAVLILDNQNSSVVAYCGSADFRDREHSGQVDGVRAVRSPGSTLKPALYALAMENGNFTPQTRLLDVPTLFGAYQPDNFDQTFRGPVTLEYALRNSLNIPAVAVLRDVGLPAFVETLRKAGYRTIAQQEKELGLSVILGGCGVTLAELTRQFNAFARKGVLYPIAFTPEEAGDPQDSTFLFSEGAAWLIRDILSGISRPDVPNQMVGATDRVRVAWKTGTSYGRRDAWSIGYSDRYTIGVWIGNFSGEGAPDLSGATLAVPLLFDLFNALERSLAPAAHTPPKGVGERKVCANTGNLPGPYCTLTKTDYYLEATSHRRVCTQERAIWLSADSAVQYCSGCLPQDGYITTGFSILPPELTLWYDLNQLEYPRPPAHNPLCTTVASGAGPQIVSPTASFEYLLERGGSEEILLQATSDNQVKQHYWYSGDKFLGSCTAGGKIFYKPKTGRNKFAVVDDMGRKTVVEVSVAYY